MRNMLFLVLTLFLAGGCEIYRDGNGGSANLQAITADHIVMDMASGEGSLHFDPWTAYIFPIPQPFTVPSWWKNQYSLRFRIDPDTGSTQLMKIIKGRHESGGATGHEEFWEARRTRILQCSYAYTARVSGPMENFHAIDAQFVNGAWMTLLQDYPSNRNWSLMNGNRLVATLDGCNELMPLGRNLYKYFSWDVEHKTIVFVGDKYDEIDLWNYGKSPAKLIAVHSNWIDYFQTDGALLVPKPQYRNLVSWWPLF